jgi:hypothetical protein
MLTKSAAQTSGTPVAKAIRLDNPTVAQSKYGGDGEKMADCWERLPTRAVHHFSESKNGVKLALNHKVRSQPRFQENETRSSLVCLKPNSPLAATFCRNADNLLCAKGGQEEGIIPISKSVIDRPEQGVHFNNGTNSKPGWSNDG